eukprot:m.233348 g.233348  ORF g.233348 m.233348 type:complete len:219 (+) comp40087_c0_seq7:5225-5881(+)
MTCDSTFSTGDCGFKSSECSRDSKWQVAIRTDDESTVETVELPTIDLNRDCKFDVCVDCLRDRAAEETGTPLRRKRMVNNALTVKKGSKSFCIFSPETGVVGFDTMPTDSIDGPLTRVEFNVRMLLDGFHHMIVRLYCSDSSSAIRLDGTFEDLAIPHFDWRITHEQIYRINLADRVSQARKLGKYTGECSSYRLEFQIALVFSPACVEGIAFFELNG